MSDRREKKGYLLENFRLFHLKDLGNTKFEYHFHEFYKILFFVSGQGDYFIEGKRYALEAGDIVLIGKHCTHRPEFKSGVPCERIILYISPDFIEQQSINCNLTDCFTDANNRVLRPNIQIQRRLFSLVIEIEKELASKRYGNEVLCTSLLLNLLVQIARNTSKDLIEQLLPMRPENERIASLLDYLDEHLSEELHIPMLAEKYHVSRYHLMRSFHEETGCTIHAYITLQRLILARDLISHGISATTAAFQCGYNSYSTFSRAYKAFFGATPTGRLLRESAREETFE